MDIDLLKTFLEQHLTQAAISSHIAKLEKELGISLFDLSSRDIQCTPEGKHFLHHARKQLAAWDIAFVGCIGSKPTLQNTFQLC